MGKFTKIAAYERDFKDRGLENVKLTVQNANFSLRAGAVSVLISRTGAWGMMAPASHTAGTVLP
jgi:hypothetical protein